MRFNVLTTALFSVLSVFPLVACEKSSSPGNIAPPQDPVPATAAPASAAPAVTAAAATVTAAPAPSPTVEAAPSSVKTAAAVDAGKATADKATALKPASKRVAGKNFTLDLASAGCKAASECAMTIKLVAVGDYHVNKEYPYKFVANAAPNVAFLGKGDAVTFSRAAGDFVEQGEKSGTMTVRFKPASAGDAIVAGTYKFSVCSADQCQIEQEKIDLAVPVL